MSAELAKRILLILDLDETLIHASEKELGRPADFQVFYYHVYKRPFLESFLRGCHEHFELAIWSSAADDYVQAIVKQIIPEEIRLAFVWGRSRCTYCFDHLSFESSPENYFSHYHYVKVLKKVKKRGYSLERTLIIDDTPTKSRRNYGNAIYPKEYTGEPEDNELRKLLAYLTELKDARNVRAIEKRNWKNQRKENNE